MRLRFCLLFATIICLQVFVNGQTKPKMRIVGNYALNTAMKIDPKTVPFDLVTHINLTFLNPDDTLGNFTSDYSSLTPFVKAAHAKNVKVLLSIAGGSRHAYYAALLKDGKREKFISDFVAVVLKTDCDGINNDIEGGDVDENYEKFAVEMANALKAHNKLFSVSLPGVTRPGVTDKAIAQYDYINIMSYDHTGSWRPDKPGPHASYEQAVADLDYFRTKRSVPDAKLNLGVPFYGYAFGPELTSKASSMNYKQIIANYPDAESVDQWNMPGGQIIYYNGLPTIRKKAELAKGKAGGIMIWQVLGDAPEPHSLLKAINEVLYGKN